LKLRAHPFHRSQGKRKVLSYQIRIRKERGKVNWLKELFSEQEVTKKQYRPFVESPKGRRQRISSDRTQKGIKKERERNLISGEEGVGITGRKWTLKPARREEG